MINLNLNLGFGFGCDLAFFFTEYYCIPILIIQMVVCYKLMQITCDRLTWGLLITGSIFSIIARLYVFTVDPIPWLDDAFRAFAITLNNIGFISLFFLLKRLLNNRRSQEQKQSSST